MRVLQSAPGHQTGRGSPQYDALPCIEHSMHDASAYVRVSGAYALRYHQSSGPKGGACNEGVATLGSKPRDLFALRAREGNTDALPET